MNYFFKLTMDIIYYTCESLTYSAGQNISRHYVWLVNGGKNSCVVVIILLVELMFRNIKDVSKMTGIFFKINKN